MPTLDLNGDGRVYWEAGPERYASLGRTSRLSVLRLERSDRTVDLLKYLPEGWKARIGYAHACVDRGLKEAQLEAPATVEWLGTAMHEIGHVEEEGQPGFSRERYDAMLLDFQWENSSGLGMFRYILSSEFFAWEFALRKLRSFGLSEEYMRKGYDHIKSDYVLASYVRMCTTGWRLGRAAEVQKQIRDQEILGARSRKEISWKKWTEIRASRMRKK